jgi:3-hydroxyisobutyrate dehydrogenase-like beta-hydroxyacid dehydrogenase
MKLGFIGLGHMGRAMATRLLEAGHEVTVYNRSRSKAEALRTRGARVADRVADACEVDAVITMVADDAAIESIVFGADGVLAHLPRGSIHVSSSSISVAMARRLDQAHERSSQGLVAAPVLGRPEAAEAGKLFVLAAGPHGRLVRVEPVFAAIGQRTFEVSDRPELALLVKLSCNFLTASVIEAVGEAMALVEKSGLDPHRYLEIVTSTLFGAPAYKTYGELIAERHFEPAEFAASLGEKDIRLVLEAAESLRVPMPVASLLRDRFLSLLARFGDQLDWSALGGLAARDAGLERR